MDKNNSGKIVEKSVLIIIFAVIFYSIILFYNDFDSLLSGLQFVDWLVFPLILLFSLGLQFLTGVRYHYFIKELGVKSKISESMLISLAGQSMLVTPGRVGTLIKSYIIKKKFQNSQSSTFPAIIMEQLMELIAATLILSSFLIWITSFETQVVVSVSLIILSLFFLMIKSTYFFTLMKKLFKIKFLNKYLTNFEESKFALTKLLNVKNIVRGLGISIVIKLLQVFMIFLILEMIGLEISFLESGLIYNTSLLIGVYSFIPAGIVVTDTSLLALLTNFDDNFVLASAGVLFIRFVTLWFNVIIGFIVLKTKFKFLSFSSS